MELSTKPFYIGFPEAMQCHSTRCSWFQGKIAKLSAAKFCNQCLCPFLEELSGLRSPTLRDQAPFA
ncbi:hypothetical protein [Azospirillum argentinense]